MGEGYVNVLVCLVLEQKTSRGIDPREAQYTRDGVCITSVVEVLDVVHVFEIEPVLGLEQLEAAELR